MALTVYDGITMPPFILIGNPGNRRTDGLQQARLKLGLEPAIVVSYLDLLQGRVSLSDVLSTKGLASGEPPLLRLDAPGENFEVERALIALGAPDAVIDPLDEALLPYAARKDPQPLPVESVMRLEEQVGRIWHPSQWFRGYGRLLARLEREALQGQRLPAGMAGQGMLEKLDKQNRKQEQMEPQGKQEQQVQKDQRSKCEQEGKEEQRGQQARWLNAPADIAAMFDKRYTHRLLTAAGVRVPRLLAAPEELSDYESLHEAMRDKRMHRVFIKLACGSGASGVMAYQIHPRTGAEVVVTTVGVETFFTRSPIYYNAGKLRRYTDRAIIRRIVNWLLAHGAHVEQWIAKASCGDRAFDIRQLVVCGQACHSVARASRTPITNLHLRSKRMLPAETGLPESALLAIRGIAEQAMAVFPRSAVAGIDVLVRSGDLLPYIAELNPFGDLLYNIEYQGFSPYEWEMEQLIVEGLHEAR
ncbi:STM4014 family protein [Paenibacillus eucommiae]|uniref:ATP-grasp domain-containing protein n=1 Tax=Paenibacillus eucommiae TaxID=1355755 RepID=A0ABS4ISB7_9BACL|nr:STM4014 family protein [Paenibacillus eucommiae]MBP1990440.1 hypothetical protein [Paenibacillus eucommiae]